MGKKGLFDIRIKFDNTKIVDQKCNTIDEADSLFKDFKKKLR